MSIKTRQYLPDSKKSFRIQLIHKNAGYSSLSETFLSNNACDVHRYLTTFI